MSAQPGWARTAAKTLAVLLAALLVSNLVFWSIAGWFSACAPALVAWGIAFPLAAVPVGLICGRLLPPRRALLTAGLPSLAYAVVFSTLAQKMATLLQDLSEITVPVLLLASPWLAGAVAATAAMLIAWATAAQVARRRHQPGLPGAWLLLGIPWAVGVMGTVLSMAIAYASAQG